MVSSSDDISGLLSVGFASADDTQFFCQYRSKKCWNLRALKQNGAMHKLCEFHRDRANVNQRRLEQRRRARRGVVPVAHGLSYVQNVEYDLKLLQEILTPAPMEPLLPAPLDFKLVKPVMVSDVLCMAEMPSFVSDQSCSMAPAKSRASLASPVEVGIDINSFELLDMDDLMVWNV